MKEVAFLKAFLMAAFWFFSPLWKGVAWSQTELVHTPALPSLSCASLSELLSRLSLHSVLGENVGDAMSSSVGPQEVLMTWCRKALHWVMSYQEEQEQ